MRAAAVLLVLAVLSLTLSAQTPDPAGLERIKQLAAEERWPEIVRAAEADPSPSADLNYYHGLALARLERWDDAEKAFERGRAQAPRDKRFPIELAGINFKQKRYGAAAKNLHRALRLDPDDEYAVDFLGSVYFLQGNIDAALKYWNRVSRPRVEQVLQEPPLEVDQVLLDRAFRFAPASVLKLSEMKTTEARVDGLGIFPDRRFDLEARPDGSFDVVFRARERNGWGANKWQGLINVFRGLPFQTIHPEYYNIGGRGINAVALLRWDSEKRRIRANLSGPFSGDPKRRYHLDLDLRDENWDIRDFSDETKRRSDLKLRKQAFSAGVTSFESGRWSWSTEVELSHRKFLDVSPDSPLTPELLSGGFQLKHSAGADYILFRIPERRLTIRTAVFAQLGRTWSEPSNTFAKIQGSIETHWFPQARGDDYEMRSRIRVGRTLGEVPFDELFILGVERDNDLWLRAHAGTRDGRKGNAPMGRNYVLSNWEIDKNVYSNSLITLKLGPFLDIGRISGTSGRIGSDGWLWDLGMQAKVKALGQRVVFSYGRDLRSGGDVFFVTFR
ncbi:MAG: tetratricopeptide repeat protein [Aridibacter famidurans]|nr:tetratricopeptide repeat protein [Aridibacter famidurans]